MNITKNWRMFKYYKFLPDLVIQAGVEKLLENKKNIMEKEVVSSVVNLVPGQSYRYWSRGIRSRSWYRYDRCESHGSYRKKS